MKIFFITSKLNFKSSGSSIGEFDLMMRTLQELGNEVTAITAFSYKNDIPKPLPYSVIEKKIMSRRLLGIQYGIYKILKEFESKADFFHIDGHAFLYAAGLYRRLGGKIPISAIFNRELVCWPESEANPETKDNFLIKLKKRLRFLIEKNVGMPMANGIDLMLFSNPHLRQSYEKFGLKPNGKNIIFGDPFDYQKIMRENNINEDSYIQKKNKDKLNIFYSSRMVSGKGFELLIEAFSKVKNKEKFNLILGGTGPLEPQIRHMVRDLNIENYVQMPGWIPMDQMLANLKIADIFIQPSWRTDLTSISLIEAMSFGLPCILPAGGGLAWDAKDSALYFNDGDANDLAKKIEQLSEDSELRTKLSQECYKRLKEDEMNYKKQIIRWEQAMKKIKK